MKTLFKPSGNKIIDDFIRFTQVNLVRKEGKLEFVPYEQFKNIEFIAEGGFSKIYKATWVDGPINWDNVERKSDNISRKPNYTVVLKKINDSKNITSKELNELKVYYDFYTNWNSQHNNYQVKRRSNKISYQEIPLNSYICNYFGITQDVNTQDFMIIMQYYELGNLIHYLSNDFYNIKWSNKLHDLTCIANGLINIHSVNIIHRDLHSGNIFFTSNPSYNVVIGDLGLSKSATESTDDNNVKYGIITYMAPEIFQGQKYTKASDIYSFGMIMWEFMTGRRPFWDEHHDTNLITKIRDGLRPPIVTNAPEGYIELMKECWNSDPCKRPTANDIYKRICILVRNEEQNSKNQNPTKIIESSDIGPVPKYNPGAIYKSRPLSGMINSAMSLRSSRSQSINLEKVKRKFEDNNDDGQSIKRKKLYENENNDYFTKFIELDIDMKLSTDGM
ncbi:polo kinase CDC5 [Rhizophagus irregularis DAOM 197198w]|uniref:Polo kinase CDC5 n=1 Tax=Rhizophagus irregularis (strain DAOM 197198w) TaxID=1432141 RepID=A0A015HZU1_RHIIW|nr:polo kinase CDC5 [Rhizophagus irregularis DAOM 197198w]